MKETYIVKISSINDEGKTHEYTAQHKNLNLAIRDIMTYRKRNYKTLQYTIRKEGVLF
ncbi:MAG TPA: hypothetical protein VK982_09195 [Bacteroidales bacterium]|nr:hypothetical protein [Bacteroidales bacterium]